MATRKSRKPARRNPSPRRTPIRFQKLYTGIWVSKDGQFAIEDISVTRGFTGKAKFVAMFTGGKAPVVKGSGFTMADAKDVVEATAAGIRRRDARR